MARYFIGLRYYGSLLMINMSIHFVTAGTFSCDIEPTGKVIIKGITATGERIVRRHSQVFEMRTRNLCPPGHFSVSFELPGPVDEQRCTLSFGVDGILEGNVKKRALDGSWLD